MKYLRQIRIKKAYNYPYGGSVLQLTPGDILDLESLRPFLGDIMGGRSDENYRVDPNFAISLVRSGYAEFIEK